MITKTLRSLIIFLTASFLLSGPVHAEIVIKAGWVRAHLPDRPAAGYFELSNHGEADTLIAAKSPAFKTVEIHTHIMEDGVMRMRKLERLDISAHHSLQFKPHGLHLMLFDPIQPLNKGSNVEVTLVFETAGEVPVTLQVGQREKNSHTPHAHEHDTHNHNSHAGH